MLHVGIEKIQKLVNNSRSIFEDIIDEHNTNCIESFNNTRTVLASKRIAYCISWRIRAYISIIKWNYPYCIKTVFKAFQLNVPRDFKRFQIERKKEIKIVVYKKEREAA